ncbi:MAG: hypothetical protein IJU82_02955 [Ruminiclostridium sp.]|nr:hypothetical protein [Ruminiclostridium sp.]
MKTKNLVLSLIFPIICFLFSIIPAAYSFEHAVNSHVSDLYIAIGVFSTVTGLFPLVAVILLRTDISRFLKWQIILFAAATVMIPVGIIYGWGSGDRIACFIFGVAAPALLLIISTSVISAATALDSGKKALKWLTAFFSTPGVYLSAFFMVMSLNMLYAPVIMT